MLIARLPGVAAAAATPSEAPGPIAIFQGFNTFSGAGLSTIVTAPPGKPPVAIPQDISNSYRICTSFDDISQQFGVDASVSADEFLVAKTDLTSSFLNSLNITTTSVVIGISYFASTQTEATAYELPTSFAMPKTQAELAQFVAKYGDQFVNSITKGAGYIACYVFYAESVDEQTKVHSQLTGNGVGEEGEFSVSVAANWDKQLKSITTRSIFVGRCFGVAEPPPTSIDDAAAFLPTVVKSAQSAGTVPSFSTLHYEDAGMKSVINQFGKQLVVNRGLFQTLATYADQLTALTTQMNAVKKAEMAYGYEDDQTLDQYLHSITTDQTPEINNLIGQLQNDPLKPPTAGVIAQPAALGWGTPVLNFTLINGPSWGAHNGAGGSQVTYFDRGLVYGGQTLANIEINGGDEVNYIVLTYGNQPPVQIGGSKGGGSGSQSIKFAPGETVTSVSCKVGGDWVNQITIVTNLEGSPQQSVPWPPHGRSTTPFGPWPSESEPLPQGTSFAGFSGSGNAGDDYHLWSIQPVAVQFSVAKWIKSSPEGC